MTNTNTENTIEMSAHEIARVKGMLEYHRPARSRTELDFIARYIDGIAGMYADEYGNRLLLAPDSKVMISCHVDSVHRMAGKQAVSVSRAGVAALSKREMESNCLGADDVAGIYAALRMIEAGVNTRGVSFVFHRDEESGGQGSGWLAQRYPDWVRQFDVCLALDRRGAHDVIISQAGGMCASGEFAAGLAGQLGMGHRAAEGIFTDSANYVDLIAECSNLSVGYEREHTRMETLDLHYLEGVTRALIAVDWGALPVVRAPGDDGYGTGTGTGAGDGDMDAWEWAWRRERAGIHIADDEYDRGLFASGARGRVQ